MKRFKKCLKVAGIAAGLTLMMTISVFAGTKGNPAKGNKAARQEYRVEATKIEDEIDSVKEKLTAIQTENEQLAEKYLSVSAAWKTTEAEREQATAPAEENSYEAKARELRAKIFFLQTGEVRANDETVDAAPQKKTPGAKANRETENKKTGRESEAKELRAEIRTLANAGKYSEALEVLAEVKAEKEAELAKKAEINALWKELIALLEVNQ